MQSEKWSEKRNQQLLKKPGNIIKPGDLIKWTIVLLASTIFTFRTLCVVSEVLH